MSAGATPAGVDRRAMATLSAGVDRRAMATLFAGVDRRAMATLSAGHLFTDIAQGSIPALLPFLIARDHLSYVAASALILAATISSSVIQPLFGYVSDRLSLPWLMPLGPALGGLGVALAVALALPGHAPSADAATRRREPSAAVGAGQPVV